MNRAARWTFAMVVAGSMVFGVSQAVASPAPDRDSLVCNSTNCPQSICKCLNGQCVDRVGGFWCFS